MNVAVIINGRAGRADKALLEKKVRSSLFRCDLDFLEPATLNEMQQTVAAKATDQNCDYMIVCGGDGTLNVALQPLIQMRAAGHKIPPICPIPVGTANDLAKEMKISTRIEEAARMVLDGCVSNVDVIEITCEGRSRYMLTNGGLGVPAETALRANRIREWVHARAECPKTKSYYRPFLRTAQKAIRATGDRIYELILAGTITRWDTSRWAVEIGIPGGDKFMTRAPFIMISNQRILGGRYQTAPLTNNSDGQFNVFLLDSPHLLSQTKTLMQLRQGVIPSSDMCPTFETNALTIRSLERPLTFFGDGEILHENATELQIKCVHPGIPIVTRNPSGQESA